MLVAIADGDHLASTYADGALAPTEPLYADRLLIWRPGNAAPVEVAVSNSVTSPPEVLAVSPDGRFAYVVERLGGRGPGIVAAADLPQGGRLTAVPLGANDEGQGSVIDLGPAPEGIDLRADGRMLAVVSNTPDRSLVHLVPVKDGTLGAPVSFDLADLGIVGGAEGPRGGVTASSVFWQPGQPVLAVTINTQDRVTFFRVEAFDDAMTLVPWGSPIGTGSDPFTGRFTPDGRHFLTLDWGRDLTATTLEGRLPTTPSRISVIRMANAGDASGVHRRLGDAPTDLSSEGIAVSPDGTLVVSVNMRQTALPASSPGHTREASVTLLFLDPDTGALTPIDEVEFPGVLPEGATFDRSGTTLLVTAFERRNASGGALFAFAIEGDGAKARLAARGLVPTPHGVHHVVVR